MIALTQHLGQRLTQPRPPPDVRGIFHRSLLVAAPVPRDHHGDKKAS